MSPPTPATLNPGERVNFTVEYSTIEADGVRIWGRPVTDGELAAGYRAHGSPLYTSDTGNGSGYFYFETEATVDQIRIQMWDEGQDELLYEEFIPVDYRWRG